MTKERTTHVFHRPDVILKMLGHMRSTDCDWETFSLKECERDIFVCTIKGAIHDLFYNLLRKQELHNSNVRVEDSKIVQFNIRPLRHDCDKLMQI